MQFRTELRFISILLFVALFSSCAMHLAYRGPVSSEVDISKYRAIGIFIHPSGNDEYDQIMYNLLSLRLLALGYEPVNLNPVIENSLGRFSIYNSQIPAIRSIHQQLKSKNLRPDMKIVAVVNSRFDEQPGTIWAGRTGRYYELYRLSTQQTLTFMDMNTGIMIADAASSDTADVFVTSKMREDMDRGKIYQRPPLYTLSPSSLLKRNLSRMLGSIPVSQLAINRRNTVQYPVVFYVGESYRETYGEDVEPMLMQRLIIANDIFSRSFSFAFQYHSIRPWDTEGEKSITVLLERLDREVVARKDTVFVGIVLDSALVEHWDDYNVVGMASILGNTLVVKDLPTYEDILEWDALDEALVLVHELGHNFGSPHVLDKTSVMYEASNMMHYHFDDFSRQMMKLGKIHFLESPSEAELTQILMNTLKLYQELEGHRVYILPLLSRVLMDDEANLNTRLADILKEEDVVLYRGVLGFKEFRDGRMDQAYSLFSKVVENQPSFGEAYLYMAAICHKEDNHSAAEDYLELAIQYGFEFRGFDRILAKK